MIKNRDGNLWTAAILVAGNTIGVGFYAIPVLAGPAGFMPGMMIGMFAWLYMLATGLLYIEAILANPDGSNFITVCRNLTGPAGMWLCILAFVTINYYYLSAFYDVAAQYFSDFLAHQFNVKLPQLFFYSFLTLIIGGAVFLGTFASDRLNFILFTGFVIAFIATIFMGTHKVSIVNLKTYKWYFIFFAIPVFMNAFEYQNILPTMATYLNRDRKKLVQMVVTALSIALLVYATWHWLATGSTPQDQIWVAFESNKPVYEGLTLLTGTAPFQIALHFAAFFGVTTSLIGTGLALVDFLGDGFGISIDQRKGIKRLLLCLCTFVPGVILSYLYAILFVKIDYLVGWAEIIFTGVLPIWLVTKARYVLFSSVQPILPGGKWMLLTLGIITFFLGYLEGVELIRS